ncbi:hypothetical protein KR044_007963, partial [Drosophila immigrans]
MFVKLCVLFLAVGLSQAGRSRALPEVSFMQYMMNSRALGGANSLSNSDCFNTYVPQLQDVIKQWEADNEACEAAAAASRANIDDTTKENRTEIDASATNACDALTTCSKETNSLDYYDCYSKTGSDDAKIMYTISANSAELLAVVKEDYRLIQNEENVCTNKSERAYVENTAKVYADLDNCLKGITVEQDTTTSSPATSDAPTSSESTAEPDTSSVSTESTAEPDSSSVSTESTAEPDSSSVSTESTAEPDSSS